MAQFISLYKTSLQVLSYRQHRRARKGTASEATSSVYSSATFSRTVSVEVKLGGEARFRPWSVAKKPAPHALGPNDAVE